jgi:hypothetical protein
MGPQIRLLVCFDCHICSLFCDLLEPLRLLSGKYWSADTLRLQYFPMCSALISLRLT